MARISIKSSQAQAELKFRVQTAIELRRRKEAEKLSGEDLPPEKKNPLYARYWNDPAGFILECFTWLPGEAGPAPYQLKVIRDLKKNRRLSLRGPHGLGKTALLAWIIIWFALCLDGVTDWKIPTTASVWRQLEKFLWPEIHKWVRRLNWEKIGRAPFTKYELLNLSLKLTTGEAFAMASDRAESIEGAHATVMMYIFDESKAIMPEIWDAAEGAFSTGDCYWLSVSTPGEPAGRFYDIQSRRPGFEDWSVTHVTKEMMIKAGRMNLKWVEARRRQWGEKSQMYQNRVEGNFAASEEDSVIPLTWLEEANERWLAWKDTGQDPPNIFEALGCDIARSGPDKSVLAPRFGYLISELRTFAKVDTMGTTGNILGFFRKYKRGKAVVDVIGIGAGVVDRLRELRKSDPEIRHIPFEVIPFNGAERTDMTDSSGELGFNNCRSASYWHLRDLLNPESGFNLAIPPDDDLTSELTTVHWSVQSGGKIAIESKDDIKERLGRSPDKADALVMAYWEENILSGQQWLTTLKEQNEKHKKEKESSWD